MSIGTLEFLSVTSASIKIARGLRSYATGVNVCEMVGVAVSVRTVDSMTVSALVGVSTILGAMTSDGEEAGLSIVGVKRVCVGTGTGAQAVITKTIIPRIHSPDFISVFARTNTHRLHGDTLHLPMPH